MEKYEKNFKKGMLTDDTLPLLTESALQECRIPPGPRLLILSHAKAYTSANYTAEQVLVVEEEEDSA